MSCPSMCSCVSISGAMLEEDLEHRLAESEMSSASPGSGPGCGPVLVTLGEREDGALRRAVDR